MTLQYQKKVRETWMMTMRYALSEKVRKYWMMTMHCQKRYGKPWMMPLHYQKRSGNSVWWLCRKDREALDDDYEFSEKVRNPGWWLWIVRKSTETLDDDYTLSEKEQHLKLKFGFIFNAIRLIANCEFVRAFKIFVNYLQQCKHWVSNKINKRAYPRRRGPRSPALWRRWWWYWRWAPRTAAPAPRRTCCVWN